MASSREQGYMGSFESLLPVSQAVSYLSIRILMSYRLLPELPPQSSPENSATFLSFTCGFQRCLLHTYLCLQTSTVCPLPGLYRPGWALAFALWPSGPSAVCTSGLVCVLGLVPRLPVRAPMISGSTMQLLPAVNQRWRHSSEAGRARAPWVADHTWQHMKADYG